MLLQISDLKKSYAGVSRLEIDSLALDQGDRLLILGHNGSGKSTLLKLLAGVIPPSAGELKWQSERPTISYLPQSGGFIPGSSLLDNLQIRGALYGISEPYDDVLSSELLPEEVLHRPIQNLSGAYQRIAALAIALYTKPACLLLDEPLTGLDESNRTKVADALNSYARETSLFVVASPTRIPELEFTRQERMLDGKPA